MIRQPTPEAEAYRWWRQALVDASTPRHDGEPQPGFYKRRMVKGGPWVPVEIRLEQEIDPETGELVADEYLAAEQLGWSQDPVRIWTHLRPIPRDEYDDLLERHRAEDRMAATHVAFDVSETPILPGGH